MIALAPWQALLDGLGSVLSTIYDVIPDYGLTIIVMTVLIRVVLLPLGIKQIRSMHTMQLIQPEMKKIQTKYKNDRAKQQEEIMKLYQRYGASPLSGCWPVLLQFPILIAMYSVLRHPQTPNHLPAGELNTVIQAQVPDSGPVEGAPVPAPEGTTFLGMNLLCTALQAGDADADLTGPILDENGEAVNVTFNVNCGEGAANRIPYYAWGLLMLGTTWYQQRQMQRATPQNAASAQQQAILRVMPIMFGIFGFTVPAGLVVYWTVSNMWQIGQQYFMLKSRPSAEALEAKAKASGKADRKGWLANLQEKAEEQRRLRDEGGSADGKGGSKGGGGGGGRGPGKRPGR